MPVVDNFDSYTDGDLNGQGSWSGDVNFDVQGSVVKAGAKAISVNAVSANKIMSKTFTAETTGSQVFWMRLSNSASSSGVFGGCRIFSGTTEIMAALFWNTTIYYGYWHSSGITVSRDTWYKVEIQWNASTDQTRVLINDTDFDSGWISDGGAFSSIDKARIDINANMSAGTIYFDELSAATSSGPTFVPKIIIF